METTKVVQQMTPIQSSLPILIYEAAINGRDEEFKRLVKLSQNHKDTYTAMHLAVTNRRSDVVVKLLSHKAPADVCDYICGTPLHIAVKVGDIGIANLLIDNPFYDEHLIDLDQHFTSEWNTALHIAVQRQDFEFVKLLVSKGADVNLQNKEGHTPLHIAATDGSPTSLFIGSYLITQKAKVNIDDYQGNTPQDILYNRWKGEGCNHSDNDLTNILLFMADKSVKDNRKDLEGYDQLRHENSKRRKREVDAFIALEFQLERLKEFIDFVRKHFLPNSSELCKHYEELSNFLINGFIDDDGDFDDGFDPKRTYKLAKFDYKELEMDVLSVKLHDHLTFNEDTDNHDTNSMNKNEKDSIIEVIRKVRPLFPHRTNEQIFHYIKQVQSKISLKNLSVNEMKNQIAEVISQEGGTNFAYHLISK